MTLQAIRENLGLSQAEMGARVGENAGRRPLHYATISRFENGQRDIGARLLRPLARAYGLQPGDIVWVDVEIVGDEAEAEPADDEDDAPGRAA